MVCRKSYIFHEGHYMLYECKKDQWVSLYDSLIVRDRQDTATTQTRNNSMCCLVVLIFL